MLAYGDDLPAEGASSGGKITLRTDLTPGEGLRTLVHELAHEMLHQTDGNGEGDGEKPWQV